jgi:hypothetical protein
LSAPPLRAYGSRPDKPAAAVVRLAAGARLRETDAKTLHVVHDPGARGVRHDSPE